MMDVIGKSLGPHFLSLFVPPFQSEKVLVC